MKFSTKIDWWILLLLLGVIGFVLFSSVVLLIRHEGTDLLWGIGGILICLAVLFMTVPTRYFIGEEELLIRAGPFRWRIPLEKIQEVHKTNNPLSAPAWSLRRLHLSFINKKGKPSFVLISPKLLNEFLKTLQQRAPHLESMGDRLQGKTEGQGTGGTK